MSGMYSDYQKKKYFAPQFYGSGLFFPCPDYSYDNIYEGLGIDIVKCQHCYSEFLRSETSANCKNCGAPVGDWTL